METEITIFIVVCITIAIVCSISVWQEEKKIKAIKERTAKIQKETDRIERETELMRNFIKEIGGNEHIFDELNEILDKNKIQH